MTAIESILDDLAYEREADPWDTLLPMLLGGVALALVGGFGLWFLAQSPPPAFAPEPAVAKLARAPAPIAAPAAKLFGALPDFPQPLAPPLRRTLADLDPKTYGGLDGLLSDAAPDSDEPSAAPIQATLEAMSPERAAALAAAPLPPKRDIAAVLDDVPLPPARPAEFAALGELDNTSAPVQLGPSRSLGPALAYASPDTADVTPPVAPRSPSIFSLFGPQHQRPAGYDDTTAVYDISAKILYMPDGTTIEAHSGLGNSMDDITQVGEHAKGPTPPDLYDLQLRESPFHGITAIRLLPVGGDSAVYGREGLLAHPFMMGDNGDSNGCVSIKDYNAFLKAYQDGKIRRLAVIAKDNNS
jgi:type VI secretion system (T6SS) effector TldE1-like protein